MIRTLGEFIEALEQINDKSLNIMYDFGSMHPTSIRSWRGSYSEVALGYDHYDDLDNGEPTVQDILDIAKGTVGKRLPGFKGGVFTMDEDTELYIDNWGDANNTVITSITESDDLYVIIHTSTLLHLEV